MAKTSAMIFGVIFVIAGIWGFFSQPALGFIAADVISSVIHLIVGIVLLVVAGKSSVSTTLKTVGIVYVIFAILGFVQGSTVLFGAFATDMVTNWFYLVVGIVIAILGWTGNKSSGSISPSTPMSAPTSTPPQM